MIRGSLYTRIVLAFLVSSILGLTVSFFVTGLFFTDKLRAEEKERLVMYAQEMAETYNALNHPDLDKYLETRVMPLLFYISLFDSEGRVREFGYRDAVHRRAISQEEVQAVLAGSIHYSWDSKGPRDHSLLGYPVEMGGQSYALFIEPADAKNNSFIRDVILTSLIVSWGAGSLFILIGARYLVNPLKLMTRASRRIAKGDFDISFDWKPRRDELGELAQSFTEMAGELKQMERMRQDFVSNVSHEIQSPLTSIAGFSQLLQQRSMEEQERTEYLRIIQAEAQRLSRLSENLLKLASLESEHHPFHPETYALDEQLRSVILSMEPIWSGKELELDLELPAVKVHGDADQLNQVWMNLIGNAMKFTPAGGTVRVALQQGLDQVKVQVSDTGIGFPEEEKNRLFERFYKADRSRTSENGGSGLGLSIVKKIIDLHGGSIEAASRPGQGAEFTVTLPHKLLKRRE